MENYKFVVSFIAKSKSITEDILTRFKTREDCLEHIGLYMMNGWELTHVMVSELLPAPMTMKEYAIKAFHTGSDKCGESVTGTCDLYYNTDNPKDPYYSMTVQLVQDDGHPCTSGIGFYYNIDSIGVPSLRPCSGHMLYWVIPITDEIAEEMRVALHGYEPEENIPEKTGED
jgi:hypothetical protein